MSATWKPAFGIPLFIRDKGRIAPTPAGDAYYRRAIDVPRAHDAAGRAVRAYASRLDGQMVVGLMPTMTRCTLAPARARFVEAHPNVNVHVTEGYSAALTQMVRSDDVYSDTVPELFRPGGPLALWGAGSPGRLGASETGAAKLDEYAARGAGNLLRDGYPLYGRWVSGKLM